jgi:hypothetical protein
VGHAVVVSLELVVLLLQLLQFLPRQQQAFLLGLNRVFVRRVEKGQLFSSRCIFLIVLSEIRNVLIIDTAGHAYPISVLQSV